MIIIIISGIVKRGSKIYGDSERGWSWDSRNRMRWLDGKILTSFVMHFHISILRERRTSFCFSHIRREDKMLHKLQLTLSLYIYRARTVVVLWPWLRLGHPFALAATHSPSHERGGKKSTGRNYFVVTLFARSDPGRTQASAAFLFSCLCVHDDNLYIGERPRLARRAWFENVGVSSSHFPTRLLCPTFCVRDLYAFFSI